MPAAEGNKYAEKWTREATLEKLTEVMKCVESASCVYIGEALALCGVYGQWYSAMADKFKDDDEVSETIKRIDQAFEAKLVGKTLKGELNPTMAIFTLKNKHQWNDKSQKEVTYPQGVSINYTAQPGNAPLDDAD